MMRLGVFRVPLCILGVALTVYAVLGTMCVSAAWAQAPAPPDERGREQLQADITHIAKLYYAGQLETVVREAGPLLARHGLTLMSVALLLFEAEARLSLGDRDEAIRAYERALPVLSTIDSVQQRRFAFIFFRLAGLARQKGQLDQALARVETGLRLEPQNMWAQVFRGQVLGERGDRARALTYFKELAASSWPTNEERAVVAMKTDRLMTGRLGASVRPPDMRRARVHERISIGLIPLHDLPKEVVLADVCVAIEAAWRIRCEVLELIAFPDASVFAADRGQYDADRVLDALSRWYPVATRPRPFLLAVAGRDLFAPKSNYVFSYQTRGGDAGNGVMSAARFAAGLDDVYEKDAVVMRRVTIQAISTVGSMLGFSRPTSPECPTAFPIEFREFQHKRARLCASDEEQRDAFLKARGGAGTVFGEARSREIERVYRAYYLE